MAVEAVGTKRGPALLLFGVWVITLGVTFLDRFGFPLGGDQFVPFCLFTTYFGMFVIVFSGFAIAETGRVVLYLLTAAMALLTALLATLVSSNSFSLFSLEYLLIIYAPFVFIVDIDDDLFKRSVNAWQICMLPIALMGLYQFITQDRYDFLKDHFSQYMITNFNTRATLGGESALRRSDGMFLLEPSGLSQFCSIALALELIYFKKLWRIGIYALGMVAAASLSGVVMFAIFLGVYAWRYKRVLHVAIAVGFIVAGMWAYQDNEVIQTILNRRGELSSTNTSGYQRFVAPINETAYLIGDLGTLFTGIGPGNSSGERAARLLNVGQDSLGLMWPPLKLVTEYGVLALFPYGLLIWRCFFFRSRSYTLSTMFLVMYVFMSGGLLTPQVTYVLLILQTLFPRQSEALETADQWDTIPVRGASPKL
jgi:hypothetical protein